LMLPPTGADSTLISSRKPPGLANCLSIMLLLTIRISSPGQQGPKGNVVSEPFLSPQTLAWPLIRAERKSRCSA
jgi:hypothetical protein